MITIFCSHSSKDKEWVISLQHLVEEMGHSMYLFEDDPRPGEYVVEKIQKEIEKADAMLVILTRNTKESHWVDQEIGWALRAGKRVIPLVEKGVSDQILAMLGEREYISFDGSAAPDPTTLGHIEPTLGRLDADKTMRTVLTAIIIVALCVGVVYMATEYGNA